MSEHGCADCGFRKKYDDNPRSFLGKVWRWHAGWCPGWRKFMESMPEDERREWARRYDMKKWS